MTIPKEAENSVNPILRGEIKEEHA
jgi:hypothetical protein